MAHWDESRRNRIRMKEKQNNPHSFILVFDRVSYPEAFQSRKNTTFFSIGFRSEQVFYNVARPEQNSLRYTIAGFISTPFISRSGLDRKKHFTIFGMCSPAYFNRKCSFFSIAASWFWQPHKAAFHSRLNNEIARMTLWSHIDSSVWPNVIPNPFGMVFTTV